MPPRWKAGENGFTGRAGWGSSLRNGHRLRKENEPTFRGWEPTQGRKNRPGARYRRCRLRLPLTDKKAAPIAYPDQQNAPV